MGVALRRKYVLHPGNVRSQTDGQWHHVSFAELALLYRVSPGDCLLADPYRHLADERYIHLHPDPTGEYKLPQPKRGK